MVDNVNANWGFGMRYGSVCSGVEAASLAWESLGWQPAWFAEIEPFPAAVLNHHWPHIPNHGDMTQLEARILSGEIEAPDILVGGTPCQAFSVAGLRNSLADERGNLTLILVRILNAIDEVRKRQGKTPAILVWENVPGVLSTKDNAFGSFLGGLAGEELPLEPAGKRWTNAGCVFGEQRSIAWRVLDAQFFGVPQRRKRVFLVAGAGDIDPAEILFERQGKSRGVTPSESEKQDAAGFVEAGFGDFKQRNQAGTLKRTGGTIGGGSETLVVHGRQDPCVSDKAFCLDNQGAGNTNVVVTVAATLSTGFGSRGLDSEQFFNGNCGITVQMGETLYNKGFNHGGIYASTQETHAGKILRTLREAVGEEVFAKWGLGILKSLQSPEILRQALHGRRIRPATFSRSWVVYCALSRAKDSTEWLLQSLRETGCEGCPPQGWELPEQLARELGAYLSELSQPGAQASRFMRDLWWASQGTGLLREALSAIQEVGRPAGGQGQSILGSSEGWGEKADENVLSSGMQCEVSRERVLHKTCATGEARDSREGTAEQERSGKGWVGETPFAVRRLTVEECEFLQGFPRGYTQIPWRGKPAEECPDAPRYKACGNSMAVPCMRFIGKRIQGFLNEQI